MKKKIIIALSSFIVVVLLAFACWLFCTPVFNMVIALPDFPENIQVYKMVKPDITVEDVTVIGAKLGMTGEVGESDESYLMSDKETGEFLRVFKATGAFRYDISSKLYPEETPVLTSSEEAALLAANFLAERGWLDDGVKVSSVVVGGEANGVPAHLLVIFDRPVDGYQFQFAADKDALRIGDGGEIVSMFINPVKYEPYQVAALKPVKQAYQELKKTRSKYIGFGGPGTLWVSIDSVSIEYWLNDVHSAQDYIYPVYVFRGQCHPGQDSYTGWVEAIHESSIDFPAAE